MLGRVTSNQIYAGGLASIQTSKARLSVLQQQASSGSAISKPSDDPTGTAQALAVRGQIAANTQYATNISDGQGWLTTADSTLTNSENLVRQAKDLMVQAANGTTSDSGRAAIATQLQGIRDDLLAQANTKYLGRSVFAGTSDSAQAFAANGTYNGVVNSSGAAMPVTRQIANGVSVTVSADGAAAFGVPATTVGGVTTPSTSVFTALDTVIAALKDPSYSTSTTSPGAVTAGIDQMGTSLTALTAQHAVIGSNMDHLDTAKTQNSTTATALQTQQQSIEGIDTTKVLLDLKTQELAYQAALQVTASTLQPTLMSFLQ